jgi:hypothetical protein
MPETGKHDMQCHEFEAWLSEALDGTLSGPRLKSFQAHAGACPACGPLFAEAAEGQRWLKSLAEVEPPADLVRNILLATSGPASAAHALAPSWWERFQTAVWAPVAATVRQPRFAMSFGMAFFSLSIALNIAGVKLSDLRQADLRPSAIRRSYHETYGRVVKYYDNIRLVYEIQSRVRDFQRATTPAVPARPEDQKERKNNSSGEPEKQERNYSQSADQPVLASAPAGPALVKVTAPGRLV